MSKPVDPAKHLPAIRWLLQVILAVLVLRIGLDHAPIGHTSFPAIIGVVSLYVGIGILLLMAISGVVSVLTRLGGDEKGGEGSERDGN